MQSLEALGWDSFFDSQLDRTTDASLRPARVAVEHRGRYRIIGSDGASWATPAGRLRHEARSRLDLPAVGDWVTVRDGVVHGVLARKTRFVREAAGGRTEPQVIAANLDVVFVVASLNRELNPRRIERYVVAVWDSGAAPVIVLNKADLGDAADVSRRLGALAAGMPAVTTSAVTGRGLDQLRAQLGPGRTGALVGSSGVGKSTLVNALLERDALDVGEIRAVDDKGRHTTTRRELFALPGGAGLLIDTPGMREFALWSDGDGAGGGFEAIEARAAQCRFGDCSHTSEPGCAVRDAVADDDLASYHKLQRELSHQQRKQDVLARKEQVRKWKVIHKAARKWRNR